MTNGKKKEEIKRVNGEGGAERRKAATTCLSKSTKSNENKNAPCIQAQTDGAALAEIRETKIGR